MKTPFSISANTATLLTKQTPNNEPDTKGILEIGKKYIIPIYQRPYSWGKEQLKSLLSDIFISFNAVNGDEECEPIFIGTMQVSIKNSTYEIIDGQQRLTTFLILIKVLKEMFPKDKTLNKLSLDWLESRSKEHNQSLLEYLESNESPNEDSLNRYERNAFYIKEYLDEEINSTPDEVFSVERFMYHLTQNMYFVMLYTSASLSKTLQIFKTINTTGLELNGGDVFKIRLYEYLTEKEGFPESVFNDINHIYEEIEKERKSGGEEFVANIHKILSVYQKVLIARHSLPLALYSLATETFFERLFDTMFKVEEWKDFKGNIKDVKLSLEDLHKILDVCFKWGRLNWSEESFLSVEDKCLWYFSWQTRYSIFIDIIFVYMFFFRDRSQNVVKDMVEFYRIFMKLLMIYSIRYAKQVNAIKGYVYSELMKKIATDSSEEVLSSIKQRISKPETRSLRDILSGNINYNSKLKGLICRLSAMLEEDYLSRCDTSVVDKIFRTEVDIEHIQPFNNENTERRAEIQEEWGENLHSIGNLVVLESSINRSISNSSYLVKKERYRDSKYIIVKNLVANNSDWDLKKCEVRKINEVEKIMNYLFSH